MTAPPVSVSGLTRRFGDTTAVEDVSFDVGQGRVTGLLGRNGAGKTTTLRMLLGLARPDSGTARVFGKPYPELPAGSRRVGVSMGGIGSVPGMTVAQDLAVCARVLGVSRRRCDEVLDVVDMHAAGKKVAALSTGMRQRHGLAVALLANPELLVLDEPATGLDPDGIRWLRDMIRGLAAEGRTVLLSSHQLAEVEQTVDDVVIVQQDLRFSGTLEELTRGGEQRLEERFFDLVGSPTEKEVVHGNR